MLFAGAVHAERYMGDSKDLPGINNLVNILSVQHQELKRLIETLERLEGWKSDLDKKNSSLAMEGELAKQDKQKADAGEMSAEALNKKWHASGRSLKHDRDIKVFREEVAKFNVFVKDYNALTKKMNHILSKRTPIQVSKLISNMHKLIKNLRSAIKDGNIEKAKYIARQSAIASEFGYSEN